MKEKITKEHRLLDDTDLNIINNTFKEIKHEFNNTFKEIKQDNINNFNRIDNTFNIIKEELKHFRDVNDIREKANDIRLNSMEKSNDIRYYTLLAVITFSSILLSILKVLF